MHQVSESFSGYTFTFETYLGECKKWTVPHIYNKYGKLQVTPMMVHALLQKAQVLGKGYHVDMYNYYNSPLLCELLLAKKIRLCGTLVGNRVGLPKIVTKSGPKLKRKKNKVLSYTRESAFGAERVKCFALCGWIKGQC